MYQRTDVSYQLLVAMWIFHEIIGILTSFHITTHWAHAVYGLHFSANSQLWPCGVAVRGVALLEP